MITNALNIATLLADLPAVPDWIYLATSDVQHIEAIDSDVKGLALPKRIIDNIYYSNARRVFGFSGKTKRSYN